MIRVRGYIDGFNLYHAIDRLGKDHLKWLNLRALLEQFIDPAKQSLDAITYFSAFATWLPYPFKRHLAFVRALHTVGVTPVMAKFYEKPRECRICGYRWTAHEEKSTDVNAAVSLVADAYEDRYDRAFLLSRDSDLAPAVRLVCQRFPRKRIVVISPPGLKHSYELIHALPSRERKCSLKTIKLVHLERSLFPQDVKDAQGKVVATRPSKYDPPVPQASASVSPRSST